MFRLVVAQAPAALASLEARIGWLEAELTRCKGADLVLLPELFACGYNIGDAVQARAERRDGPTLDRMSDLARKTDVALHYGFAERADGKIYNAAACLSPEGELLSHQRKLAIPPGFERKHFSPGAGCTCFEYRGLRIATLICYDAEFPETLRHVASLGAELVLVPTALSKEWPFVADHLIPTRAFENGVYLAYANSAGVENGLDFLGRSVIATPDGAEAARAEGEPAVIQADLDPARVRAARKRLPYLQDRLALKL